MSFHKEKALELVDLSMKNHRLAHAYLITGPEGSGKEEVAIRLVEMTLPDGPAGARSLEELRSPTTVVLGPESKSRRITIDAVRSAEHVLHMACEPGITKFAVIKEADRMGVEAENAFLKTLEEPPESSRLVLITARPEILLETILSRCIRIDLIGKPGPPEIPQQVRGFLEALAKHSQAGTTGISGALGLMSVFAHLLREEKSAVEKVNQEAFKVESDHYLKTTDGTYLKQREEYYRALTESEYLNRRNQMLEFLLMWFGDALRQQNGARHLDLPEFSEATAALARRLDSHQLAERVDAVDDLRAHLNTNATEGLALEVGFIKAFR